MSVSTNGQLCYGCLFEEGYEFPWSNDEFEYDIEVWWQHVKGFVNPEESPYDENGNHKPGVSGDSRIVTKYWSAVSEWNKNNPIPVEVINYCSDNCPMYLLSTKTLTNRRGFPVEVKLEFFKNTEQAHKVLVSFLEEFNLVPDSVIGWWLSSYYG